MKYFLIVFLLISLLLLGCVPTEKKCTLDSDCVAATCCHATAAVNKQNAPNCKGILCTAECKSGTLDCGQATLKCVKKECSVVSSS